MFAVKTAEIAQGFAVQIVAVSAGTIMVTSLALGFVVFIWLVRFTQVKLVESRALWLVPILWIVSEYARAIIFSVVSLGPGGRIGPYWAFGDLGFYVASTPLAFIARFGGVYLLSGVIVCILVATYQSWRQRSVTPLAPVLLGVAVVSLGGWALYRTSTGPIVRVGAVSYAQHDAPIMFSKDSRRMLDQLPSKQLDTLVLPEYSHYFEDDIDGDRRVLERIMNDDKSLIIHSARDDEMGTGHNMLTFQAADSAMLNQQQKWFVVPAGEYVPYIYQVVLAYAGQESLLLNFNQQKSVQRGEKIESPYEYRGVRYGAHACSGVLAPDFYNQLVAQGSDVLTNSAALDTMGISPLFHAEATQMNQLVAISQAKPFVQSAKGGPAYVMDKDGRTITRVEQPDGGVVSATVQTNRGKTVYGWLGDWVVYLSLLIVGFFGVQKLRQHFKRRA